MIKTRNAFFAVKSTHDKTLLIKFGTEFVKKIWNLLYSVLLDYNIYL